MELVLGSEREEDRAAGERVVAGWTRYVGETFDDFPGGGGKDDSFGGGQDEEILVWKKMNDWVQVVGQGLDKKREVDGLLWTWQWWEELKVGDVDVVVVDGCGVV